MKIIPVIDVFAGPGGLNEGFNKAGAESSVHFKTALSIEMDPVACRTLRLRTVRRQLEGTASLSSYFDYIAGRITDRDFRSDPAVSEAFRVADREVLELELGPTTRDTSRDAIRGALQGSTDDWVLIGGPPCQAYSLAGRSRRANDASFKEDKKHFLYREYLAIIQDFAPSAFVMENVKGMLSSKHSDNSIFQMILSDLTNPKEGLEYEVLSLAVTNDRTLRPADFVLRAERYGVPQRRHRVILVGIRADIAKRGFSLPQLVEQKQVSVLQAIGDLPRVRSGISPKSRDSFEDWLAIRTGAASRAGETTTPAPESRGGRFVTGLPPLEDTPYHRWVWSELLEGAIQHESRAHMESDLRRYFHIAATARTSGISPRLSDLPLDLLPRHKNAQSQSRAFDDRFRVQIANEPSTTVVSHISKDGHYYIHPDPEQMRSLTVREVARLQSFPDDYFFEGNRTQQYHQVGNAVPPFLAWKIGNALAAGFAEAASSEDPSVRVDRDELSPVPAVQRQ